MNAMADLPGTIAAYTVDRIAYSPSPPIVFAIVDFDGGGRFPVELTDAAEGDPIFSALPGRFPSFQWHEYAAGVPPGAVELARNDVGPQAYRLGKAVWGVQFHPEVSLEQMVGWIRSYGAQAPVPPESFVADAERHIAAWNVIGRSLCARFLDAAVRLSPQDD